MRFYAKIRDIPRDADQVTTDAAIGVNRHPQAGRTAGHGARRCTGRGFPDPGR